MRRFSLHGIPIVFKAFKMVIDRMLKFKCTEKVLRHLDLKGLLKFLKLN